MAKRQKPLGRTLSAGETKTRMSETLKTIPMFSEREMGPVVKPSQVAPPPDLIKIEVVENWGVQPEEEDAALEWLTGKVKQAVENKTVISELVELDPALAKVLIDLNSENRPINQSVLRDLKHDILNGHWRMNGETIIIADTGELNDGQHRCLAVLETGESVKTLMAFGVPRPSRMTVDTGSARTPGHLLSLQGVADYNHMATIAKWIYIWEQTKGDLNQAKSIRATKADVTATFFAHRDEIEQATRDISPTGSAAFGSYSGLVFAYIVLSRQNKEQAKLFFERLMTGANLQVGNPILACINKFRTDRGMLNNIPRRMEILFRAWNLWRKGHDATSKIPLMNRIPKLER